MRWKRSADPSRSRSLRDGEGAEHLIEVTVNGAADDADARAVARTVAASSLVKTAVHGADPNWGRIAAAAGRSGVRFDPDRMRICIGDVAVYDGSPLAFDERRARRILGGRARAAGPRPSRRPGQRHRLGL